MIMNLCCTLFHLPLNMEYRLTIVPKTFGPELRRVDWSFSHFGHQVNVVFVVIYDVSLHRSKKNEEIIGM